MKTNQSYGHSDRRHQTLLLRRDDGVTLIEVMSAMVILALGILSLAPMVVVAVQSGGQSQDVTEATMVAQDLIEQYRQLDSLPAAPFVDIGTDSLSGLTRYLKIDDRYTDPTVPAGMNKIGVTVKWTDKAGVARLVAYETFVMDK